MNKLILGGLTAAAIVGTGAAFAQNAPVGPAQQARIAKTHTRGDVQAHVARMFARLDTNRDGVIVKQEADDAHGSIARPMERRSHNGDRSKAFERIDSNRDGMISRQEFAAAPRHQGNGMRSAGMRGGLAGRMFEMADVNKDGRVSLPEAQQVALQRFDRLDLNRDGNLTPDERRQGRELMKAQRRPA